jgi:iron-sulfur cluster assembly accessory protein
MNDESIQFTDAAATKVAELIRGEGNPELMLRVYVQGGGCSGMQYGFEFDEAVQEGDTFERRGVVRPEDHVMGVRPHTTAVRLDELVGLVS